MTINKTQENEKLILALEGRLDTISSPQLQEILLPALEGGACVELDFAKLAYLSSAGLRILLLGEKTAKEKGGSMKVLNVSEEIKEVFDMTGFSSLLKIE